MNALLRSLLSASALTCATVAVRAQCPAWIPDFKLAGVNGEVRALTLFDDGSGPALYCAGSFSVAGSVAAQSVARFDGSHWSAVGALDGAVYALVVFDDGGGPALYATGAFMTAAGVTVDHIARWDGSGWSPLAGGGLSSVSNDEDAPTGRALAVHDDGTGAALYVGGAFDKAGDVDARNIARWDGTTWSALGSGTDVGQPILALASYDDGSGSALYAGGSFSHLGTLAASCIARWDGTSWSKLGSGVDEAVEALVVHDDGDGPALFVGGRFTHAGGASAQHVARWNGARWSALGSGTSDYVHSLAVFDDGDGPALIAGGEFTDAGGVAALNVARWRAARWSPLAEGLGSSPDGSVFVYALASARIGAQDARLFAGGKFSASATTVVDAIAAWDGASWSPLGAGAGMNAGVDALALFDDGAGSALYAGGEFTSAGASVAQHVARWDGAGWSALGSGIDGGAVHALASFDDGNGAALYAGGSFVEIAGVPIESIARFDGTQWSSLAGGVHGAVRALRAFDDGHGPALFVAGEFTLADGQTARCIARWDGLAWSVPGGGVTNAGEVSINSLAVFDDGSGSALYAGGLFSEIGGVAASCIARWNGSSWSALGRGLDGAVRALHVFDDGSGPALYVGGAFSSAGGAPAWRIARWNGASWTTLGPTVVGATSDTIDAFAIFDDGSGHGARLYAGGRFAEVGGVAARNLACWNGASWSQAKAGTNGLVSALVAFDDHTGVAALFAGGGFTTVGGAVSASIGKLASCNTPGIAFCLGDGSGTPCPCGNESPSFPSAGCTNSSGRGATLAATGTASVQGDTLTLIAGGMPLTTTALYLEALMQDGSGLGSVFGDGLLCIGGSTVRLGVATCVDGGSNLPAPNEPSLSALGSVQPGQTRTYQVLYRDAPSFCSASTFNLSSALRIYWMP